MISEHKKDKPEQAIAEDTFPVYQHQASLWRPRVKWSLVVLTLIAIAVFVWLPSYVDKPQIDNEAAFSPAKNINHETDTSPWFDAQLARQRKAAQQVLTDLLDLQFSLEEKSVRQWANTEFENVERLAGQGDTSYRKKDFVDAANYYQQGLDILLKLEALSAQIFTRLLSEGQSFLLQKDSFNASERFKIALAIAPENTDAISGFQRSEVLDQVLALQAEALSEYKKSNIDKALAIIDKALALDKENTQSVADHSSYRIALKELKYGEAMSQGYKALIKKQYSDAEQFFKQATQLKPSSAEASTALQDTADKQSLEEINKLHQQAKQLEENELWSKAKARYTEALKHDNNLIFARVGAIRTKAREELHNKIETILKTPQRLGDQSVFRNTQALLKDAQSIPLPGKKLLQQIEGLRAGLELASTPLTILLQSDNQTDVKIHRIGQLGSFYSQQLNLIPGAYVATGSRPGFRDVRVEFTVSAENSGVIVNIQCNEPI